MIWEGLNPPYATVVADPPWDHSDGWPPFGNRAGDQRPRRALPYSHMTVEEIAALPVAELAAPGAHLYLWTTARFLWAAKPVVEAWGWRVAQPLVWCKEPSGSGPGGAFANTTEFVLFARRPVGSLIREAREAVGLSRRELHQHVRGGRLTGLVQLWETDDCFPNRDDWARLREVLPVLTDQGDLATEPARHPTTWWQWKRGLHSTKPPAFLDLIEQVSPAPRVELFARAQRLGWDSWGWGYEGATA